MCPICKYKLYGSASRGKLGTYYPRYHCGKRHKYWGVNKKIFDKTIKNFVKRVRLVKGYEPEIRKTLTEDYNSRLQESATDHVSIQNRLKQIEAEQEMLIEKIKLTSSSVVIKKLETEIDDLESEKESCLDLVSNDKGIDLKENELDAYLDYFMNHLDILMFNEQNPFKAARFFGSMFDELPSYDELISGDVKLNEMWEVM